MPQAPTRELVAESLRIVDSDGQLRLVVHNRPGMPAPRLSGVDLPGLRQGGEAAGLMFYDGEGNECGGLVFGASPDAGGRHRQALALAFDACGQDQVVELMSEDVEGERRCGLRLSDRPSRPLLEDVRSIRAAEAMLPGAERDHLLEAARSGHAERAFLGRERDGTVHLTLRDAAGAPRLRLAVAASGAPAIEFLDAHGAVAYRLAPEAAPPNA